MIFMIPGSFDPVTNGHLDIIRRASTMGHVMVAIGTNPSKQYLFTEKQRLWLMQQAIKGLNAEAFLYTGLTVDLARMKNAILVKGFRDAKDFEYEKLLIDCGKTQQKDVETIFMFSSAANAHISSGAVKAICKEHGFIHDMVPLYVKQALESNLQGRSIVGLTGDMGCGKSYVGDKLQSWQINHIDLDKIAHSLLTDQFKDPMFVEMRHTIANTFGDVEEQFTTDLPIDRLKLSKIVFSNKDNLSKLNSIMFEPIMLVLKRRIAALQGVVLLNSALLCEVNLLSLCNNNVILVDAPDDVRLNRLRDRGMTKEDIDSKMPHQLRNSDKKIIIEQKIAKDNWGSLIEYHNIDTDKIKTDRLAANILNLLYMNYQ